MATKTKKKTKKTTKPRTKARTQKKTAARPKKAAAPENKMCEQVETKGPTVIPDIPGDPCLVSGVDTQLEFNGCGTNQQRGVE